MECGLSNPFFVAIIVVDYWYFHSGNSKAINYYIGKWSPPNYLQKLQDICIRVVGILFVAATGYELVLAALPNNEVYKPSKKTKLV